MTTLNFVYAVLAGLLPAFVWLYFWSREDFLHPEPRNVLASAFLAGSLSVIVAIFAEKYAATFITDETYKYVVWATIEEAAKFIAVASVALFSRSNDEPIDSMIYCITAAIGFAALENLLFVMGPLSNGHISIGLVTGGMRFIGATLVHIVCSAVIGFFLGITFYKSAYNKFLAGLCGLLIASGLHAAFNLSIINSTTGDAFRSFAWVWGAVIVLIIMFEEVKAVKPRKFLS